MSSIHFANPWLLTLLLPVLAIVGWEFLSTRRTKASLRFSATTLLSGPSLDPGEWRLKVPVLLKGAALVFLILALARPQRVGARNQTSANVTDIMICLDASGSMASEDFRPKNRFAVAKEVAKNFIMGRKFDRVGLVVFGKIPMTQCPLTMDDTALASALNAVEIGTVPPDATAIGDALITAVSRLERSAAKSKVIILVTDGANNAGVVDPLTAARAAATTGIRIYTIGVGVPGQGRIPVQDPVFGKRYVPIEDDLDEPSLQRIALSTGGRYFRATSSEALEAIFKQIDEMEKTDIKIKELFNYEELFRPLALIALLLLSTERILTFTLLRVLP